MNSIKLKMTQEIFDLTAIIQNAYPELYKNLTETPLFISYKENEIKNIDYKQYLDFLKTQLKESSKNIKNKKV